jgi:hypothetical protein
MPNPPPNPPYQDPKGPKVAALNLASKLLAYVERVNELGLTLGGDGQFVISEELQPAIRALHVVLSGGRVEVSEVERGNPDVLAELDRRVLDGLAEASELNKRAGFYLSAGA